MKKKIILMLALCALMVLLTSMAYAVDYTTGSPWLDPELPGNVTEDTHSRLQDNFALAANLEAYQTTEIPSGYSKGGTVTNRSIQHASDLVELFSQADPSSSHEAEISIAYYQLCMDWDTRNELGFQPVLPWLNTLKGIGSIDALTAYFSETDPLDMLAGLLTCYVECDPENASVYSLMVDQPALLLGDAAYYYETSIIGERTRNAYHEYCLRLLQKAGYAQDEAESVWSDCIAFETQLAEVAYPSSVINSPEIDSLILNRMRMTDFVALCGDIPVQQMLANLGLEADEVIVCNPEAVSRIAVLYNDEKLEKIRAYLILHGLTDTASALDRECFDWALECSNAVNNPTPLGGAN